MFDKLFGRRSAAPKKQRSVQSTIAGTLVEQPDLPGWWEGAPIEVPFFSGANAPVIFSSMEPDDVQKNIADFDRCLKNLLVQGAEARAYAEPLIHKNCRDTINSAEWDGRDALATATAHPSSVWQYLKLQQVCITRRVHNEMDIYASLSCQCEWEQEHGLQLVFRQGKQLTRIGPDDGHLTDADAWNIPDDQDKLLSTWKG
jgi:hypothetical protein